MSNKANVLASLFKFIGSKIGLRKASLEESVSELIQEHQDDNSISKEEKELWTNVVEFKDLRVSEIMIPRTDIKAIAVDAGIAELREKFLNYTHTRLPVYKDNIDNIIGFVHIKDCIKYIGAESPDFTVESLLRKILFVPRTMKVIDLLHKMQSNRVHISIILDEYGGVEGLVTTEDLVEEIIGDIKDEHEDEENKDMIQKVDDHYIVDARAYIDDLEEELKIKLIDKDHFYETFGGFIMSYLGKIPVTGEKFTHPAGIQVEITHAEDRKIRKTKVYLK